MPRSFTRITIAPGIYRDGDRLIAEVRSGSARAGDQQRDRKIFPLGTDEAVMIAWQLRRKSDMLTAKPRIGRGTLAADVRTFIDDLPDDAPGENYKRDSEILLGHWAASELGALPRHDATRADVLRVLGKWKAAGVAVSTRNMRLSRLRVMYHTLDGGPDKPNPTDKIKRKKSPAGEPRDIPIRIIKLIIDCLPDRGRAKRGEDRPTLSITKRRIALMAWLGHLQVTITRITPRDIDWKGGRIYLRPRRKGGGADGAWVRVLPEAMVALRAFVDAGLLGLSWSNSSALKTWRVGIARATKRARAIADSTGDRSWLEELENLPARCKPYDLRHSLATTFYAITGDIRAVKELLQHASLETTERYTKGAVSIRVDNAITQAAPQYAKAALPPALPPARKLRIVKKPA